MQLNASRLKVLQAQDDLVNDMKEATSKALVNLSDDKKTYRKIIQGLIIQVVHFSWCFCICFQMLLWIPRSAVFVVACMNLLVSSM